MRRKIGKALLIGLVVVAGLLLIRAWTFALNRDPLGVAVPTVLVAAVVTGFFTKMEMSEQLHRAREAWQLEKEKAIQLRDETWSVRYDSYKRSFDRDREEAGEARAKLLRELDYFRKQERIAAGETTYLRQNPGAVIRVAVTEATENGSYFAARELISPAGEIIKSERFGCLVD